MPRIYQGSAGGAGGAPSGPAGGDLGSTYPNPTVAHINHAAEIGAANGVATLDANSLLAAAQLPLGTTGTTATAGNDARLSNSRTPTGAAGGDLGGNFPNPTVAHINNAAELGAASGVATLDAGSLLVQNVDASKLASGTLNAARLPGATNAAQGALIRRSNGAGTALTTDDLAVVSGVASLDGSGLLSSAQRPVLSSYIAANVSLSNGAYQDLLTVALLAGHKYSIRGFISLADTSTATLTVGPNANAGLTATDIKLYTALWDDTNSVVTGLTKNTALGSSSSYTYSGLSGDSWLEMNGWISVNVAGTLAIRAERGATGTIIANLGSWLHCTDMT